LSGRQSFEHRLAVRTVQDGAKRPAVYSVRVQNVAGFIGQAKKGNVAVAFPETGKENVESRQPFGRDA